MQYLFTFCSRPEEVSDVISFRFLGLSVPQKCVKFRDTRSNHSGESLPKAVACGIFGRSSNFDKCQPEVAGNVISGVAVDFVGSDVRAKCSVSRLENDRIIRLFGRSDPFYAILYSRYLIAFCSRPEAATDVISGKFLELVATCHKRVKFGAPGSNCSREIPPDALEGGISMVFVDDFRLEVDSDVISGTNEAQVGMDVPVKFDDSRLNRSRDEIYDCLTL